MGNYIYDNPTDEGYIQIKLTTKEHNKIFRTYKKGIKYEVYESKYCYRRDSFEPLWMSVINIILYPVSLLINGLSNIKELNSEIYSSFNQKQTGHFYSEYTYKCDLTKINNKEEIE